MSDEVKRQKTGFVRFYDTAEQMFEAERKAQERLAEIQPTDWQEEMKPGDCFVRLMDMGGVPLDVYGEVIDIKDEEDAALMRSRPDLRTCRCFSKLCPEGELGTVFIISMSHKIPREMFESAKSRGWPYFYQAFGQEVA